MFMTLGAGLLRTFFDGCAEAFEGTTVDCFEACAMEADANCSAQLIVVLGAVLRALAERMQAGLSMSDAYGLLRGFRYLVSLKIDVFILKDVA